MSRLITIATYSDATFAEAICSQLREQGIPVSVSDTVSTMLWHVGSALGGVKLQAPEEFVQEAQDALAKLAEEKGAGDPWMCRDCRELVDREFEVCWSCGKHKDVVRDKSFRPVHAELDDDDELDESTAKELIVDSSLAPGEEVNPYAASGVVVEKRAATKTATRKSREVDELVLRAWRSSIIGFVLLPPLLHFYSMYLLMTCAVQSERLSSAARWRFAAALILNIAAAIAVGMMQYVFFPF